MAITTAGSSHFHKKRLTCHTLSPQPVAVLPQAFRLPYSHPFQDTGLFSDGRRTVRTCAVSA
jgi:hypothetical protein